MNGRLIATQTMSDADSFELHWPGLQKCVVWAYPAKTGPMTIGLKYQLVTLKVKDDWQGQGIGSAVVRQLQRRACPIRLVPVAADAERQQDLERFYRRLEFTWDRWRDFLIWEP